MHEFSVDAAVLRLLRTQHGFARVSQLYHLGMSKDQIAGRVRKRVLRRYGHGIVGLDPPTQTAAANAMRGVLRAGDGAVACRWTAAELHRIDAPRSGQLHVVILGDRRRCRRDDLYIHRTRYLPDSHATILDAVPVTSVGRTLVDCATHLDHWHALRMLDSVSASAAVWRTIHTTAQELSNGRAGVRAIADVTAPDGARRFRSVLERRAAGALRQHGMPEGEWNVVMHDAQGRIREADLRFRSAKLVVEFDGLHFHQRPNQAQRDRAADRRLALAGWRVLRFTWQDVVFRTSTLVREISAALLTA